ncbi:hypothetical protein [Sandaracinus amylolyticus]|uniref:hypothetical protein n=1 Tax=Sandaracinus amylolyticus TaxID=927083 RepID=UPI001F234E1E|nr:hypothetical protein [Sandaracinus amylolyticus]UJR80080.1 Hypothetical protein I5071_21240 [Sandaracinus amylolyticus]
MRRAATIWATALAIELIAGAVAFAQEEIREPAPRVELGLEGEWPDALRLAVRADLDAALRAQGLELVHAEDGAERVVATVRVTAPSESAPACLVRIDDVITGKHVERAVDLTRVPSDGWSVAIAAGADELLRASWAELAIADAPPPAIEPPPAVEAYVEQRVIAPIVDERLAAALSPPLPRPALSLGARGAVEGYLGGLTLFGGDLTVRLYLAERVGLELGLGARVGLDEESARGVVRSWMLGGELGPVFLLVSAPSPVRLEAFVVARAGWLSFEADANGGSIAQDAAGAVVMARAGLRAALAIDRSELGVALGLGVPILGREAIDDRGVVVGLTGLEIHAALSFAVEVLP